MADDGKALRARIDVLRLRVDVLKAGPWDGSKHPRFPKGDPDGGKFAPGSFSDWFSGFFGGDKKLPPPSFGDPKDLANPHWAEQQGPQIPWHTVERKGSVLHPALDNKDRPAYIHKPTEGSSPTSASWSDPEAVLTVVPGQATPKVLNGVKMAPWAGADNWQTVGGQNPQIEHGLPDLETVKGMHAAAGVIIEEPDGRVWLTKPLNGFGGYRQTFPKGTQDEGLTLQQTAIKEAWEETGLKIELTGVLGDFRRTTSVARYYLAKRVGGTPAGQGWESQALRLVPHDKVASFLNMPVDRDIWKAYKAEDEIGKERGRFIDPAAMSDLQARIDALAVTAGVEKAYDEDKHPRWPKGSPLAGQFMASGSISQVGQAPVPAPPQIGSASNPGHQKKADAAYAAAVKGDTGKVKALLNSVEGSAPLKATYADGKYSKPNNGNTKYAQQAHQYIKHLHDQLNSSTVANLTENTPDMGGARPADLGLYKKIGGKLGGTSAAGQYVAPDGTKYYVKGVSGSGNTSSDRAKNEVLASKLLKAAGAGAPDMHLVHNLPAELNGGNSLAVGVASKMVTGAKLTGSASPQALAAAREDFAAHAWLANYDVIGAEHDNTVIDANGKAVNIDPGGALLFRAQGKPKYPELPFGQMPHTVEEWDTLRNGKNAQTASIYGGMTRSELSTSALNLANVDDKTISNLVAKYGPGTPGQKLALAAALVKRKEDILKRAGIGKIVAPAGGVKEYLDSKPETGLVGAANAAAESGAINEQGWTYEHSLTGKTYQFSSDEWKNAVANVTNHHALGDPQMLGNMADTYNAAAGKSPGASKSDFKSLASLASDLQNDLHGDNLPTLTEYAQGLKEDGHTIPKEATFVAHLENTEPGHNKFWKISVTPDGNGGAVLTKSWGKIGAKGQLQSFPYSNETEANAAAKQQVGQKVAGGYKAYQGSNYAAANEARHNEAQGKPEPKTFMAATGADPKELLRVANKAAYGADQKSWPSPTSQMNAANVKVADALVSGDKAKFDEGMAQMKHWADNEHGYTNEGAQAAAKKYVEHWNVGAKLNGWAETSLTPSTEAIHQQAKNLLEDATGGPWTEKDMDTPMGQKVKAAVQAFHAGDDKAMATMMGNIAMSGYSHSEAVYNSLSALAHSKADQFPLATGGGQTSVAAGYEADRAKPAAVSVTSAHPAYSGDSAQPWHDYTSQYNRMTPSDQQTQVAAQKYILSNPEGFNSDQLTNAKKFVDYAEAKAVAGSKPSSIIDHLEKSPLMPAFQGKQQAYYQDLATKMQDAYAKADAEGLAALAWNKYGKPAWPLDGNGNPSTMNAKLMHGWALQLTNQLQSAKAAMAAADLAKPVGVIPSPGTTASNLPALPDFDKAMKPTTNTNAASHNAKVFQIKTLAQKGDVKGLLALNYGTNTYGKIQAKLANNSLAALGSDLSVVPGQKKNSHPALTMTGNEQQFVTTATGKPLSAALTDKELPAKIDFANYNSAGKGLSSKPAVNAANQAAFDKLIALGKAGDVKGIKTATFQPIDPATGDPVGGPKPISEHPSQHIKNTQATLLQAMDEKLHPPEPLKFFAGQSFKDINEVAAKVPPKPFGTTAAKHPSNQTIGYFLAIGQVEDPTHLAPTKEFDTSPGDLAAAKSDYTKMSPDAKSFVQTMTANGGKKFANPKAGGGGYGAAEYEKIAIAAHGAARELPPGTTIYKWDDLTADMKNKLALAQPGLIIQNPAPVCASYHPTTTKGFGSSHRFKIVMGKGAKVVSTFSYGGGHPGEGEFSLLPNYRLMVLGHKKNAGGGWSETTVMLLPPDPELAKKAKSL